MDIRKESLMWIQSVLYQSNDSNIDYIIEALLKVIFKSFKLEQLNTYEIKTLNMLMQFMKDRKFTNEIIKECQNFLNPLSILYQKTEFYAPEFYIEDGEKEIRSYLKMFNMIFTNYKGVINKIFKVEKIFNVTSANGKIFIMNVKTNGLIQNKLLIVKVPLRKEGDSLTYEYYVGSFLNCLRSYNIPGFALVYGRFKCPVDEVNLIPGNESKFKLCTKPEIKVELDDYRLQEKSHVVYEYVRNTQTNKVKTMFDFIKFKLEGRKAIDDLEIANIELLNMLKIVLASLQLAQDKMQFTHYDLHLSNVLVAELAETPNGKRNIRQYTYEFEEDYKIRVVTKNLPHIIDYGRSYINTNYKTILDEYKDLYNIRTDIIYEDYEKENVKYNSFVDMQNKLVNVDFYVNFRSDVKYREDVRRIELQVQKYASRRYGNITREQYMMRIRQEIYKDYIGTVGGPILLLPEEKEIFKKGIEFPFGIPDTYYRISLGITPNKFNPQYDLFRFTRAMSATILYYYEKLFRNKMIDKMQYESLRNIWQEIKDGLEKEFIFYVESQSILTRVPIKSYINNPLDVIKRIDNMLLAEFSPMSLDGGAKKSDLNIKLPDITSMEAQKSILPSSVITVIKDSKVNYTLIDEDTYDEIVRKEIRGLKLMKINTERELYDRSLENISREMIENKKVEKKMNKK